MLKKDHPVYKLSSELEPLGSHIAITNKGEKFIAVRYKDKVLNAYSIVLKKLSKNNTLEDESVIVEMQSEELKDPKVVLLGDDKILTTWCSDRGDASGYGIMGKIQSIYNLSKNEEERFIEINDYTYNNQRSQQIISLDNGNFIVVWESLGQDCKQINSGIYAKIFNKAGEVIAPEFKVNDYVYQNQDTPSIAKLSNDNFIIAWQSFAQGTGSGYDIYARIFDINGNPLGVEFRVNDSVEGNQEKVSVIAFSKGGYAFCWQSKESNTMNHNIYGKIYDEENRVVRKEFILSMNASVNNKYPLITSFGDNSFAIAWEAKSKNLVSNIYLKKFNNLGVALFDEFKVNVDANFNIKLAHILSRDYNSIVLVSHELSIIDNNYQLVMYEYGSEIITSEEQVILTNSSITSTQVSAVETSAVPTALTLTSAPMTEEATALISTAPTLAIETSAASAVPTLTPVPITETAPDTSVSSNPVPLAETFTATTTLMAETSVSTNKPEMQNTQDNMQDFSTPVVTQITTNAATPAPTSIAKNASTPPATSVTSQPLVDNIGTLVPPPPTTSQSIMRIVEIAANGTTIMGSIYPTTYIISSNVTYLIFNSTGAADVYTFKQSPNSIVIFNNFGPDAAINLVNFNFSNMSQLNITSGSTHINLPYNQTIIITNIYPKDFLSKNVIFSNSTTETEVQSEHHDSNDYLGYIIGAVVTGAVTIGACVAGSLYLYNSCKQIHHDLAENLPYGTASDMV